MKKDMRKIVEKGYEEGDYQKAYRLEDKIEKYPFDKRILDKLVELLPKGAKILDLGCGPGIPYDKYLVERGFRITGVDISQKHVDMARKNVPNAKFIKGDMSRIKFDQKSFNAVISLYSIFHIPKEEHKNLFLKIHKMLKDDGLMLVTLGTEPSKKEDIEDFIGSKMVWSSYSMEENIKSVKDSGFEIIHQEEEGKKGDEEHHLWILARK